MGSGKGCNSEQCDIRKRAGSVSKEGIPALENVFSDIFFFRNKEDSKNLLPELKAEWKENQVRSLLTSLNFLI